MLEIIKYQLKGRKESLALLLGIFAAVNAIEWAFAGIGLLRGLDRIPSGCAFWFPVSFAVTAIVTIVSFFLCGSGHVNDLLWRNTSYLMLTIPRRGWEILGGRLIAGLAEFLAIAVPAGVMMSVNLAFIGAYASPEKLGFWGFLARIYGGLFVVNPGPSALTLLLALCVFVTAGIALTFAAIASRSFVRNRGLATAATIAIFVFVSHRVSDIGVKLSERLGWFVRLPVAIPSFSVSGSTFGSRGASQSFAESAQQMAIPVAPFLCFLAVAAALFALSAWLLERKVEL
jgi:hypothetical protein